MIKRIGQRVCRRFTFLTERCMLRDELCFWPLASVIFVFVFSPISVKFNSFGDRSFSAASHRVWNALPSYLRQANKLQTFKKSIKGHVHCSGCRWPRHDATTIIVFVQFRSLLTYLHSCRGRHGSVRQQLEARRYLFVPTWLTYDYWPVLDWSSSLCLRVAATDLRCCSQRDRKTATTAARRRPDGGPLFFMRNCACAASMIWPYKSIVNIVLYKPHSWTIGVRGRLSLDMHWPTVIAYCLPSKISQSEVCFSSFSLMNC